MAKRSQILRRGVLSGPWGGGGLGHQSNTGSLPSLSSGRLGKGAAPEPCGGICWGLR